MLQDLKNSVLTIMIVISVFFGSITWNLFDIKIDSPPETINFKSEYKKMASPTYFVNNTIREQWSILSQKDRIKEQLSFVKAERSKYFDSIKGLFVDGLNESMFWGQCKDKNCTYLSLAQIMTLKDYAKQPSDFGTQVCLWGAGDNKNYSIIAPEYKINYKDNTCNLTNKNENNEAIKAINLTRLLAAFLVAYTLLSLQIIVFIKIKNRKIVHTENISLI